MKMWRKTKQEDRCGGSKGCSEKTSAERDFNKVMEVAGEVSSQGGGMYGYRPRGFFTYRPSSDLLLGPPVLPHCAPGEVLGHGPLTY